MTHVRVELAERVLVTWLVVDLSASMAFGTADRRKTDVAEGVRWRSGTWPPVAGAASVSSRSGRASRAFAARAKGVAVCSTRSTRCERHRPAAARLGDALKLVDGLAVQRSLVVVISDFRGPPDWQRGLLRVAMRNPTLAVEIRDPREQELANVGELRLMDPETGRQLLVDTDDPVIRELFAKAAEDERRELVRMLVRRWGAPCCPLD